MGNENGRLSPGLNPLSQCLVRQHFFSVPDEFYLEPHIEGKIRIFVDQRTVGT